MSWNDLVQNKEVLLALQAEEIAGHLLEHFHGLAKNDRFLHPNNVANSLKALGEETQIAVMEAWAWLVREGLVVPAINVVSSGAYQVSRRGERLRTSKDVDAWRNANWLPKDMLHAVIVEKIWSAFIRGEYDTAVFQAFKEVEVATRAKGSFTPTDLGVALMRKAFDPAKGPLSNLSDPVSEREALASLFAGAIGSYKNPGSHRHVAIGARDAAEMIVLASHLLYIVDSRP
jgi:uncharacterized protein (TIGR02391 family)